MLGLKMKTDENYLEEYKNWRKYIKLHLKVIWMLRFQSVAKFESEMIVWIKKRFMNTWKKKIYGMK